MNAYSIAPLVATIAYIPLLVSTLGNRPWQKRNLLFFIFLFSAMIWSLVTAYLRGVFEPQYSLIIGKIIIVLFTLTAVQFHCFTSSFFPGRKGRWLPLAYVSLAVAIVLVLIGYIPKGVQASGDRLYPEYGPWVIVIAALLLIIVARNLYVFVKMLKTTDNPVLRNQVITLIISIIVLTFFSLFSVLPWAKEYPISHFGNLAVAFILSFAVIRHRLVDIRIVLGTGMAWFVLGLIGMSSFWVALMGLHGLIHFSLDLTASLIATLLAAGAALLVYILRGQFFEMMSRAFHGSSYDYHQRLKEFSSKIHNIFSLKEQGGELLNLLLKAVNVRQVCLLFPENGGGDFVCQFEEARDKNSRLANFRLGAGNPVIKYLEREQKPLSRENVGILPAFLGMSAKEKEEIDGKDISMFVPLISRERLIAILVLGNKGSGRFSLEELQVIEEVTSRVAVSMEKEYLREQLREREEELSVINNLSYILTSSMDIQQIFGSFIEELKKTVDVEWATIVLRDENSLSCVALTSPEEAAYKVGETVPIEGSGSGWVINEKKIFIEPDLSKQKAFWTEENFYQRGLRTVAYLPLLAKGKAIGSLIITSRQPNAYGQRQIKLLEHLAWQIAMPLENSLLYAKAEKKARVDELTGLLNRRSLDEMLDNEISRHSRYGGVFSLAILDVDSFKMYNDTYGHPAGDRLLRRVGEVIRNAIRNVDWAFRYGGDEFAVLLPQTDIEDGFQVTERVRNSIIGDVDSGEVPITISIGLASWPDDGISHRDIIAAADVTLYRAKRSGGNRSCRASGALQNLQTSEPGTPPVNNIDSKTIGILRALADTVDSKDYQTVNHTKKVIDYAVKLGKTLKLDAAEISRLEACALLHDIGRIGMNDGSVNGPGALSAEEWELEKAHLTLGAEMARRVPQLVSCVGGILHHHEKFDGSGYPDGLKGEAIPLEARILAIADAYAEMTTDTALHSAMDQESAAAALKKGAGKYFDPYLVERFVLINKTGIVQNTR